jgi:hypothetical protein
VHEIGRFDGGKVFKNRGNMFRFSGNMFYDQKNNIPIKNPARNIRSGIGIVAKFCGILSRFPNQARQQGILIETVDWFSSCAGKFVAKKSVSVINPSYWSVE